MAKLFWNTNLWYEQKEEEMSNTIDVCQSGYDYEQYQLNELENENMKLKKQLEIATKALKKIEEYTKEFSLPSYTGMLCHKALKEMEGVK